MTNDKLTPKIRFNGFSDPWEQRKLGSLFSERSERSMNGELLSVTINAGVVRNSSLKRKNSSSKDKSNYKVVRKNDIAYNSMRMWQGASGVSSMNGIVSPAYTILVPKEKTNALFFAYSFKRLKMLQQFQKNSQGLTSDTWNLKYPLLKSIKVECPNYYEQEKIVSLFTQLDNNIAANEDKLKQLKEVKRLMMQKIFSQEWRFKGFTDPWEQRKLGRYISSYLKKSIVQDQYPLLTSSQKKGLVYQSQYYAKGTIDKSNIGYYIIPTGYFTYRSRSDNGVFKFNRNDLGETGIVSYFYPVFQIKNGDSNFFLNMLNYSIKKDVMIESEGTGQRVLSLKKFKNIQSILPDRSEQEKIGKVLSIASNLIAANEEKLEQLKNLKKFLMQNMFV